MTTIFILIFMAAIGSAIGNGKGRPVAGAVWGFMLGPIGWLIMAVLPGGHLCRHCRSSVHPDARICPKCRSQL